MDQNNDVYETEDDYGSGAFTSSPSFEFFANAFRKALDRHAAKLPELEETGEELFLRRFTLEMQIVQQNDDQNNRGLSLGLIILRRKIEKITDEEDYYRWKLQYLEKVKHGFDCDWVTVSYGAAENMQTVTVLDNEADYVLKNCDILSVPVLQKPRKATLSEINEALSNMPATGRED